MVGPIPDVAEIEGRKMEAALLRFTVQSGRLRRLVVGVVVGADLLSPPVSPWTRPAAVHGGSSRVLLTADFQGSPTSLSRVLSTIYYSITRTIKYYKNYQYDAYYMDIIGIISNMPVLCVL